MARREVKRGTATAVCQRAKLTVHPDSRSSLYNPIVATRRVCFFFSSRRLSLRVLYPAHSFISLLSLSSHHRSSSSPSRWRCSGSFHTSRHVESWRSPGRSITWREIPICALLFFLCHSFFFALFPLFPRNSNIRENSEDSGKNRRIMFVIPGACYCFYMRFVIYVYFRTFFLKSNENYDVTSFL